MDDADLYVQALDDAIAWCRRHHGGASAVASYAGMNDADARLRGYLDRLGRPVPGVGTWHTGLPGQGVESDLDRTALTTRMRRGQNRG